ncbi:MAG: recombination mediator RecR [Granulosicoccus sp.]|nr:recombination mediator RecR [Granulosicoccus sp.]
MSSTLLDELIDSLRCLPGVGPKSAQRMALHLLQRDRAGAKKLGQVMQQAMDTVHHCEQCRIFTESALCQWCSDNSRDASQVCVVENPADVIAIDRSTDFRGRFFLLFGHLSPLDGIGPKDLGLDLLEQKLASNEITELTLATNPTVEGQATARYITDMAAPFKVKLLQIARGIPMGSELEFADGSTLSVAFQHRSEVN